MATPVKEVTRGLEAGKAYIPPPPTITIWVENHPKLDEMVVGDTVDLQIAAHITEYDEEGRYRLEMDTIDIVDSLEDKTVKKATSEIVNLGTISPESLNAIFQTKKKEVG